MPKPALTALTVGYLKTPVRQIGVDIYCDTHLIAAEIEARYRRPAFVEARSAACPGVCGVERP